MIELGYAPLGVDMTDTQSPTSHIRYSYDHISLDKMLPDVWKKGPHLTKYFQVRTKEFLISCNSDFPRVVSAVRFVQLI